MRVLAVIMAAAVLAGCSAEINRLKGQNQAALKQRDELLKQNEELKALSAQDAQRIAEMEGQLKKAEADAEYWKGLAEATGGALDRTRALGDIPEKLMKDIADSIGAVYIPGGGIRLSSDVLFDSGKADLKASARESLKKVADALSSEKAKGLYLRVDGHTDGQPIRYSNWKDNMQLSQARSRAVWVELKAGGMSGEKMFTAGYGEYRPIDTNSTGEGRANNRRVELWLVSAPAPGSAEAPAAASAPSKEEVTGGPVKSEELPEPTK